jgi:hypothetical protein
MAKSPFVTAIEAATGKEAKPKFEPDLTAISEKYGVDRGLVGGIAKTLAGATVAAGGITASEEAEAGVLTAMLTPKLRQNLTKMVQGEDLTKAEERTVRKYIKQVEETDDAWGARERMRMADIETPDVEVLDRPIIDPQSMVGSVVVPVMGDASITGATIKNVEGVPLDKGVPLHGGPNFGLQAMYEQSNSAWESMYSAAATKQAHFLRAQQENPDANVLGVYTAMGPESMKFNTMTSEIALRQFPALKIPARDIEAFDNVMREKYPDFAGVESPDALAQVLNKLPVTNKKGKKVSSGNFRKALMTEMGKGKWSNKGFPVIDDIVRAITEPDLVGGELGASGFSIFKSMPEADLIKTARTTTYDTGIPGHYYGGLQNSIPAALMFPRLWARTGEAVTKSGDPLNFSQQVGKLRTKTQDSWHEVIDQQWADTISQYLDDQYDNIRVQRVAKGTVAAGTVIASPFSFADDNTEPSYLNTRQEADLTPSQIALQELNAEIEEERGKETVVPETGDSLGFIFDPKLGRMRPRTAQDESTLAQAIATDVGRGITEIPEQALYGAVDAVGEAVQTFGGEGDFQFTEAEYQPETVTGGLARGISQFMTGFIPAVRGLKAVGMGATLTRSALAAGVAEATVFDPYAGRLSDLAVQYPELQNPLTEFLATDMNDSLGLAKFKQVVEGMTLGILGDGFVKAVQLIKARQVIKDVAGETGQKPSDLIDETIDDAKLDDGTGAESRVMVELRAKQEEVEGEFVSFEDLAAQENVGFVLPEFKSGRGDAPAKAAENINLSNLNTTEEVGALLTRVAEIDAPLINEARRQKVLNEDLPKLADDLGMTVEDLLSRPKGMAQNAEQILAARKILVASGENLVRMAKKANGVDGTEMDLALMRRAMTQHRAIQAQVSGMTAEAGRALQQFRVIAESSRLQEKAIRDILTANGGDELNRKMAQMLSELDDPVKVGKFVREGSDATTMDMLYEFWINSLLSAPATHVVNIVSNIMTAGFSVSERKVASLIGGGKNIPRGETEAQLAGMVAGARDGMRLGWNALKTGEPTDPLQKMEAENHRAITGEQLGLSGTAGRFVDYVGEGVRVPGRLLTAGDEFFKAVGYRMELHAQAYRQAFNEGLDGDAAAARVMEIIENPPENIKMAATDAARYQTFTNRLPEGKMTWVAELGQLAEGARHGKTIGPYVRVIVPFVRTPTNIMSYLLERTPLALTSQTIRDDIAAGGARRDLALGKIATGSMVMAVTAELAMAGQITGAGPVDSKMRNILRETGWQPYSIKVGDTYYAYNRLDPIGGLLGLSADMTEILGQTTDADADEVAVAAVLAISQNMASKTYLSGVFDFIEAVFMASTDPESANWKLMNWLNRLGGSMVPSVFAAIERQISPEISATYDVIDRIKSRIPGMSAGLPPRRNIFGEVIVPSGGLGPDIISPIYTNEAKDNPVADEMVRQQVPIGMPRRTVNGVDLDAEQYDQYVLYYAGEGLAKGVPKLKTALGSLIKSPGYRNATDGPDGGKSLLIRSIFANYRSAAQKKLFQENAELNQARINVLEDKQRKLTGRSL